MDSEKKKSKNYYLTRIFGNSVNVKIIEILLKNAIAEQKSGKKRHCRAKIWQNSLVQLFKYSRSSESFEK